MLFESPNLYYREFDTCDAAFILELLNTPGWLQFIGDRNIRNLEDAHNYLLNGPLLSYKGNGYGAWLVIKKDTQQRIGMCGLFKRDYLDHPDLGFAFLPNTQGMGYAYESSMATLRFVKPAYNITRLYATTTPDNVRSQRLLVRCGFKGHGEVAPPDGSKPLLLYNISL
jgi:ribosomal-protein-alanine N-acetyltransferase